MEHILYKLRNWFLDMLFPVTCINCRKRGAVICDTCVLRVRHAERETIANIHALFDYRDPIIKNTIWKLKYSGNHHIGEKLGSLLYENFIEEISDMRQYTLGQPIYVVPIPMSKERLKERGYNQAEIIAKYFCGSATEKVLKLESNLIRKKINNIPQAKITNRNKRLNNVKDIFYINDPKFIEGKTFIIIDDVTTTGATISEVAKILKKYDAKKVVGFAIAH